MNNQMTKQQPVQEQPSIFVIYLQMLRVRQWVKNMFVFAPLIFSLNLFDKQFWQPSVLTFFAFCFVAGAVYILNDIVDVERDRLHPQKKMRPLPSGLITTGKASALGVLTLLFGIGIASLVNVMVMAVLVVYLAMNLYYTFHGKNIIILDSMLIAVGFVLRVLGGAYAIYVPASAWLLVSTFFLALLLGFAKRFNEIGVLQEDSGSHRKVLEDYSEALLRQLLAIVSASTVIAYTLYTMDATVMRNFGTDKLIYTLPFVVYGIFRYLYLVYNRRQGGDAAELIYRDQPLQLGVLGWLISIMLILYA